MTKAEYNPNPSAQWIKDTLAGPEAERWRKTGRLPDGEAIDRYWQRLLEQDDARLRESKPQVARAPKQRKSRTADVLAKDLGVDLTRSAPRPRAVELLSPWQQALRLRIRELIRMIPGTRPRDKQWVYPRFANAYVHEYLAWSTGSGDYKPLSKKDRDSKFSRFTEDLADKSTAIPGLGNWRRNGV